jgi:hypothetical protein
MSYDIVTGDTAPPLPVTVTENDIAIDTSLADSVEFRWAKPDGTVTLSTLTPVDASIGEYEMEWATGDTDQIGAHFGQIVVTTGTEVKTYPSDGTRIIWWVNPQVADLFE